MQNITYVYIWFLFFDPSADFFLLLVVQAGYFPSFLSIGRVFILAGIVHRIKHGSFILIFSIDLFKASALEDLFVSLHCLLRISLVITFS